MANWREALWPRGTNLAHQEEEHAVIWPPNDTNPYYVVTAHGDGVYHKVNTLQGCERLLEELEVSKTGWRTR